MQKQDRSGFELFNDYYEQIYKDRWENIKKAFVQEPDYVGIHGNNEEKYYMDTASVLCASCLPVENANNILDMCAAPGGKTIVISRRMREESILYANERSRDRFIRLKKVVEDFAVEDKRENFKLICSDGAVLCKRNDFIEKFDSILIDAPCSSERHVYNDEKYLKIWTKNRIKTLSMTQWSLLSSGFLMLKRGGYLLYSTCALTDLENDEVVKKVIKKYSDAQICEIDIVKCKQNIKQIIPEINKLPETERKEYGYQILPDIQNGAGPIYFSLIKKI